MQNLNMTAIIMTAIICASIVALAWIGSKKNK